jgi:hypothetical protein
MSWVKLKSAAAAFAVVAATAAAVINPSVASASTGGGCTADTAISPCIASDSNDNIVPDMYVHSGAWYQYACSSVRFVLRDITAGYNIYDGIDKGWCYAGHYVPHSPFMSLAHNHAYMTIVWILPGYGGPAYEVKSPELHY